MNSVVLVAFRRNIEWTQPHTYRSPCSLRPPPMQAATLGWSSECWTVLSWAFFYRRATELSCTQKPAQKEGGGEADGPRGFQKRTEKS